MRSRLRRLLTVLAATIAVIGISAAPAQAAAPYWQTFTETATWHCNLPTELQPHTFFRTCIIVNGSAAQSAIIISNYSGSPVTIAAPELYFYEYHLADATEHWIYDRYCYYSTLNTGFARACMGPTRNYDTSWQCNMYVYTRGRGVVDDAYLTNYSPRVYIPCT